RAAGGLQAANQLRVGDPVLARGGVDSYHPQAAEVALLVLAADVGVLGGGIDRLFRGAIELALGLVEAFRTCQQLLALGAADGSSLYAWHVFLLARRCARWGNFALDLLARPVHRTDVGRSIEQDRPCMVPIYTGAC